MLKQREGFGIFVVDLLNQPLVNKCLNEIFHPMLRLRSTSTTAQLNQKLNEEI